MHQNEKGRIKREFRARQNRQIIAITAAMFIVLLGAVLHKRPDILGALSGRTLFGMQAISIAAFLGYTVHNWRCPSCGKHLGGNIHRQSCAKCGVRFQ